MSCATAAIDTRGIHENGDHRAAMLENRAVVAVTRLLRSA
jgi:hypothetical protein